MVSVESRVRRIERRPSPKRLKANVVTTEKLGYRAVTTKTVAPDAITPNEVSFGAPYVGVDAPPFEYQKPGGSWTDPVTGEQQVYDGDTGNYITVADAAARTTADGKNTIYAQTAAPTGGTYKINDIWFDTDDGNKLYTWSGSAWISVQDTAIEAARLAAVAAKTSADGKNTIYRQTTVPTGGTYAVGDTWFDTDADNAIYRYASGATGTVSKKALTTNVATLTTTAAHSFTPGESITVAGVDATFNGTYTVVAVPTSTTLTYAKTATNVAEIASSGTITSTAGWKAIVLGDSALTNISANKITTGTIDASKITVSNIDAGRISTGSIASTIAYLGTVNASQINAGRLDVGVIVTGNITAEQITAGTITGRAYYAINGGDSLTIDPTFTGSVYALGTTDTYNSVAIYHSPTTGAYTNYKTIFAANSTDSGGIADYSMTVGMQNADASNGAGLQVSINNFSNVFTTVILGDRVTIYGDTVVLNIASQGVMGLRNTMSTTAFNPADPNNILIGSDGDVVLVYA